MSKARRVGAQSRLRGVYHAVWVTHDTVPFPEWDVRVRVTHEERLAAGHIREGFADCGVLLPAIVAGSQGGHDWDRLDTREKCINCRRALGELR